VAVELWRGAAETAVAAGEYDRALAIYDRLPEDARATFWASLGRARARLALGDLAGATAQLERAIEVAPSARARAGAWTDLATVAERGGDHALARDRLDRAIEADPDYAEARLKRGLLRWMAGENAAAETDLERAVDRGLPPSAEAEAWCGLERIAAGRGDEALATERGRRCRALASGP
jgi:tetratricopeptide (TPR) repeat protein